MTFGGVTIVKSELFSMIESQSYKSTATPSQSFSMNSEFSKLELAKRELLLEIERKLFCHLIQTEIIDVEMQEMFSQTDWKRPQTGKSRRGSRLLRNIGGDGDKQ